MIEELLYCLTYSTTLHITLLVFSRLLVIRNPLYHGQKYTTLRKMAITLIWIIPMVVQLLLAILMSYNVKDLQDIFNVRHEYQKILDIERQTIANKYVNFK